MIFGDDNYKIQLMKKKSFTLSTSILCSDKASTKIKNVIETV